MASETWEYREKNLMTADVANGNRTQHLPNTNPNHFYLYTNLFDCIDSLVRIYRRFGGTCSHQTGKSLLQSESTTIPKETGEGHWQALGQISAKKTGCENLGRRKVWKITNLLRSVRHPNKVTGD
jgi:hypothetical protein